MSFSIGAAAAALALAPAAAPAPSASVQDGAQTVQTVEVAQSGEELRKASLEQLIAKARVSVGGPAAPELDEIEKGCLAEAIMREAGGEPESGRIAVAEVIMNRAKSGVYPSTICGVVHQRGQFTYRKGLKVRPAEEGSWRRSIEIATKMMTGGFKPVLEGAMFYHAASVRPGWSARVRRIARIGAHIFYAGE